MNVDIRTEAALFPEKEYINGIFVAVLDASRSSKRNLLLFFTPESLVFVRFASSRPK